MIMVDMFCEGPEDMYHLQIQTGLSQYDIELLENVGGVFPAKVVLMERRAASDPDI